MTGIPNNDHGSDSRCESCEVSLPESKTKPRRWCSDKCRMRYNRAAEDASITVIVSMQDVLHLIFTEREIANRVRLLARRATRQRFRSLIW